MACFVGLMPACLPAATPLHVTGISATDTRSFLTSVRDELRSYGANPASSRRSALQRRLQETARVLANQSRLPPHEPLVAQVLELVIEVADNGIWSSSKAEAAPRKGLAWLAHLLITPPGHASVGTNFDDVPAAWWETYAHWAFTPPRLFATAALLEQWSLGLTRRTESLAQWSERNRASAAVRGAVTRFLTQLPHLPLGLVPGNPRRLARAIGRILASSFRLDHVAPGPVRNNAVPRIGFLLPDLGDSQAARQLLPWIEQLPPEAREVEFIVERDVLDDMTERFQSLLRPVTILPSDPAAQLAVVRALDLDVVVFASPIGTAMDALTRLALHRLAPRQLAFPGPLGTCGLPEIDLLLVGTAETFGDFTTHLTESPALLPGLGRLCWAPTDPEDDPGVGRAELGLPETGPIIATAVDHRAILLEARRWWIDLLAAVPDGHLLVAVTDVSAAGELEQVQHDLTADGEVPSSRLSLLPAAGVHVSRWGSLLACADVVVEGAPPFPLPALADILGRHLPVYTVRGSTLNRRATAAVLESLELNALVAPDPAHLVRQVTMHLEPTHQSANIRRHLQERLDLTPAFLDSLAGGLAMDDLLRLVASSTSPSGPEKPRPAPASWCAAAGIDLRQTLCRAQTAWKNGDWHTTLSEARLVLQVCPRHAQGRLLLGRAHLARGETRAALPYLLASLEGREGEAGHWHDLATALHAEGRVSEAIDALETSLRLAPDNSTGWELLALWAEAVGAEELARDARHTAARCSQPARALSA